MASVHLVAVNSIYISECHSRCSKSYLKKLCSCLGLRICIVCVLLLAQICTAVHQLHVALQLLLQRSLLHLLECLLEGVEVLR